MRIFVALAISLATASTFASSGPEASDTGADRAAKLPPRSLSTPQIQKMLRYAREQSRRGTLSKHVKSALGITDSREALTQFLSKDDQGNFHALYFLDESEGYVIGRRTSDGLAFWLLDPKLKLVVCVYDPGFKDEPFQANIPSCRKTLDTEFDALGHAADGIPGP